MHKESYMKPFKPLNETEEKSSCSIHGWTPPAGSKFAASLAQADEKASEEKSSESAEDTKKSSDDTDESNGK